jgi:hypothetical protein
MLASRLAGEPTRSIGACRGVGFCGDVGLSVMAASVAAGTDGSGAAGTREARACA